VARLFKAEATGTPLFYDILKKNITQNLPGFKVRSMLSPDSAGSVWNQLQRSYNSLVNEIFMEEVRDSDGKAYPTIICRPRPLNTPFMDSQFGAELPLKKGYLGSAYQTLQDLSKKSFIEISPAEILYEDLGKDDHSRLNMFWLKIQQAYEYAYSSVANQKQKGLQNPTFNRYSITRYGLKKYEQTLDFSFVKGVDGQAIKAPDADIKLFKAFMAQLYDMNYANHLYDVGTITCTGVLEAELGKALVLLKDPTISTSKDKIYYIEGYSHEWTFPSSWKTTFTVTHGQFRSAGTGDINIYIDAIYPGDFGVADAILQNTYLSKTKTDRK